MDGFETCSTRCRSATTPGTSASPSSSSLPAGRTSGGPTATPSPEPLPEALLAPTAALASDRIQRDRARPCLRDGSPSAVVAVLVPSAAAFARSPPMLNRRDQGLASPASVDGLGSFPARAASSTDISTRDHGGGSCVRSSCATGHGRPPRRPRPCPRPPPRPVCRAPRRAPRRATGPAAFAASTARFAMASSVFARHRGPESTETSTRSTCRRTRLASSTSTTTRSPMVMSLPPEPTRRTPVPSASNAFPSSRSICWSRTHAVHEGRVEGDEHPLTREPRDGPSKRSPMRSRICAAANSFCVSRSAVGAARSRSRAAANARPRVLSSCGIFGTGRGPLGPLRLSR